MLIKDKLKLSKLLVLILLVGLLLRIYDLPSESVSFDEAVTLDLIEHPNSDYGNPPVYYLFLDCWIKLFGDKEFVIRLPSAIFGALSILVLYYLTNLAFNKKIALLSAFIFSINPFHIHLSQQARMYSLFTLFSLLSLSYFFKVLKEERKMDWFFYFVFNLLNLYTYYFAIFVLFAEFLYFTLFNKDFKQKSKKFLLTVLLTLLLFSPQFLKMYNGFLSKTSEVNWGVNPSEYFTSIFNSFLGWNTAFTAIVFLLFLFGLLRIEKSIDKKSNFFGLFYVLLPLTVGFLISFRMAIMPRYFIFILPVYIIFISKGLTNIKYKFVRIVMILGILSISGFKLAEDYSNPNNPQWREVVDYIEKNNTKEPFDYYYKGNLTRVSLLVSENITKNEIFYNNLKAKLKADRIWLILRGFFMSEEYYKYRLEQDFRLISTKSLVGVSVCLYGK